MPAAPEFSVPAFGLRVPPLLVDRQGGLAFQVAEDPGNRGFRRDRNQHVHVVRADLRLMDLDALPLAELAEDLPDLEPLQPEEGLPPVFRREDDVVPAIPAGVC